MSEHILRLHLFGVVTELAHIPPGSSVSLEFSDPTDDDPVEWVNVHVRSSALPVTTEVHPVDEDSDNTALPATAERTMEPRALQLDPDEVTVEQLKDVLRDRDLPVGGTKQELIDRLNDEQPDAVQE